MQSDNSLKMHTTIPIIITNENRLLPTWSSWFFIICDCWANAVNCNTKAHRVKIWNWKRKNETKYEKSNSFITQRFGMSSFFLYVYEKKGLCFFNKQYDHHSSRCHTIEVASIFSNAFVVVVVKFIRKKGYQWIFLFTMLTFFLALTLVLYTESSLEKN